MWNSNPFYFQLRSLGRSRELPQRRGDLNGGSELPPCLQWIKIQGFWLLILSLFCCIEKTHSQSLNPSFLLYKWTSEHRDGGTCLLIVGSKSSYQKLQQPLYQWVYNVKLPLSPWAQHPCICPAYHLPQLPTAMPGNDSIVLSGGLIFCSGPGAQWSFAKAAERAALPP